jgi:hypothetical protein
VGQISKPSLSLLHTLDSYDMSASATDHYKSIPVKYGMDNFYSDISLCGPGSSVGIATGYGLDGLGIK